MIEETNDKILFRQDRYPAEQAPNLPEDLMWAVGGSEYIYGGVGGGQSTVSSIIFAGGGTASDAWNPQDEEPTVTSQNPKIPTPRITGVTSTQVHQTNEGVSKADVFIGVEGMEGVEYEVLVTPA